MKKFKYLVLLPLVALVSCGYSTSYLVPGEKYVSAIFQENYYRHWDNELKKASKEEVINVTDKKITSYKDLDQIDPNFSFEGGPADSEEYGEEYRMNSLDDSFNYGYQSKLFDGQMVCGAQNGRREYEYQKGRVQIDEEGCSVRFSKESGELHYFAMQFKATTDNTVDCYPVGSDEISIANQKLNPKHDENLFHESTFDLTITLYTKTNKGIVAHPFKSFIDLTGLNEGGKYKTNNGHFYTFFAFDLEEYNLSRLVGVSVSYDLNDGDALINWNKQKDPTIKLDYALFLYELFFPYTSWN